MIRSIQSIVNIIPDQVARTKVIREVSHFHDLTNNRIISMSSLPVVEMWSTHGNSRRKASRTRFLSVACSPQ